MGPDDVTGKQFSAALRGYAREEVDAFLAAVARQLDDLDATVTAREARLARYRQVSGTVERNRLLRRLGEETAATLEEADAEVAQQAAEVESVRGQLRPGLHRVAAGLSRAQAMVGDLVTAMRPTEVVVDLTMEGAEGVVPPVSPPPVQPPPVPAPRPVADPGPRPPGEPAPPARPSSKPGDTAVSVVLAGLAVLAWAQILGGTTSASIRRTASGLGQVGRLVDNETAVPALLALWLVTMVAMLVPMMLPGLRPVDGEPPGPLVQRARVTAAFAGGYLATWMPLGLAPPVALAWFGSLPAGSPWLPALVGVLLVATGFSQLGERKRRSPATGSAPLATMLADAPEWDTGAAFQAGLDQGLASLARFGPLLAVLLVVGLANAAWLAALTAVFLIESRTADVAFRRAVGVALLAGGVLAAGFPGVLHALAGV